MIVTSSGSPIVTVPPSPTFVKSEETSTSFAVPAKDTAVSPSADSPEPDPNTTERAVPLPPAKPVPAIELEILVSSTESSVSVAVASVKDKSPSTAPNIDPESTDNGVPLPPKSPPPARELEISTGPTFAGCISDTPSALIKTSPVIPPKIPPAIFVRPEPSPLKNDAVTALSTFTLFSSAKAPETISFFHCAIFTLPKFTLLCYRLLKENHIYIHLYICFYYKYHMPTKKSPLLEKNIPPSSTVGVLSKSESIKTPSSLTFTLPSPLTLI